MKLLLQRVLSSNVVVTGQIVSSIEKGLLIFIGVEKGDDISKAEYLANKVSNLRIFEDEFGKMNLSISDISGEILVVSQFTLVGDLSRGNRPGFDKAAPPELANELYEYFIDILSKKGFNVGKGVFQADMKVHIVNDGPVTFILEK